LYGDLCIVGVNYRSVVTGIRHQSRKARTAPPNQTPPSRPISDLFVYHLTPTINCLSVYRIVPGVLSIRLRHRHQHLPLHPQISRRQLRLQPLQQSPVLRLALEEYGVERGVCEPVLHRQHVSATVKVWRGVAS